MNTLQIKNEKVEIRNTNGSLVRTIGSNVVSADINSNQTLIAMVLSNGKVEIRNDNGSLVRTFDAKASSIKWYGMELLITTKANKSELRTEIGTLIRNIK